MLTTTALPINSKRGFTFLEILIVTVLIAILTSIITVSFQSTSKFTRDVRRKRDLANIQAALEIYKTQNGVYPDSTGCVSGGGWTWPGCVSPRWIPDLTSEYLATQPVDPKQNATEFIGGTTSNPPTYTYNYERVSTTKYYLLTRLENTTDAAVNGSQYGMNGSGIYVLVEPK